MAISGLRRWQREAIGAWQANHCRGIVGAVTGGGKTIFALACIKEAAPETTLIVVPTVALLDQWWEEVTSFFGLRLDDVNIISGRAKVVRGTINIGVLNTVSKLQPKWPGAQAMIIVDECHKAASSKFSAVLDLPADLKLGLSATPERPYDDGLKERLIPSLGEVIYQYTYADALRDEVIVPFSLRNVVFDLEEDRAISYGKLTRMIARTIEQNGADSQEAVSLYLRRSRVLNLSPMRVEIALRLVSTHRGERILVFHEDVEACSVIHEVLVAAGINAGLYHSGLPVRLRAETLADFRKGKLSVLVTCRALDEGFNVPETQVGIIAASTATRRQRIQRLGRVLRPAQGKDGAIVYTLVATTPEIERLKAEEAELEGVANVLWSHA
ncbi:DEAD/DEAH box helicase [Mesorhizobium sp. M0802]|uniref:DEAD/DEAH box helicase n=1 Tax=Mesorhizobium sp. M0802 TaxID=2957001 RepID=UPI0033351331